MIVRFFPPVPLTDAFAENVMTTGVRSLLVPESTAELVILKKNSATEANTTSSLFTEARIKYWQALSTLLKRQEDWTLAEFLAVTLNLASAYEAQNDYLGLAVFLTRAAQCYSKAKVSPVAIDTAATKYLAISNQPPHLLELSLKIAIGLAAATEQASPTPASVDYFRSLEHAGCAAYAADLENNVMFTQARQLASRLDERTDVSLHKVCVSLFQASGHEEEAMALARQFPLIRGLAKIALEGEPRETVLGYLVDWDTSSKKRTWPPPDFIHDLVQKAEAENTAGGGAITFKPIMNKAKKPALTISEALELRAFAIQHGDTVAQGALEQFLVQEKYLWIKSLTKDELATRLHATGLVTQAPPPPPAPSATAAAAWFSSMWSKIRPGLSSSLVFWPWEAWEAERPSWDDFLAHSTGRPTTSADWKKWLPAGKQERARALRVLREIYGADTLATLPGFPAAPASTKTTTTTPPMTTEVLTPERLMMAATTGSI